MISKKSKLNLNQGFTLVEVLIYIFVFTIVSVGSVVLLFSIQDMVYEHRANQELTRNITNVFERVMFDIRSAESVDAGASTLGSDPGSLTILDGATTTVYSLSGGELLVAVNGGTAYSLTGQNVTVTSLQFDHYDNSVSEAVRVSLTLQANIGGYSSTKNFTNTAVLLNSYD